MKKTYRRILGSILLVVIGSLILAGGCSADNNQTGLELNAYELTISVDSTIASWGYQVKVGNALPVTPARQTYTAMVAGSDTTVQILVNPGQGLPDGWYLTAETKYCTYTIPQNKNRVDVNSFTRKEASVTITAHKNNVVTVSFNPNGGSSVSSETVNRGCPVTKPDDPVKTGYNFAGWYTDNGTFLNIWNFSNPVYSDMILYAKWEPVTYYVHFDANGGRGSMSNQQFIYDVPDNLNQNSFSFSRHTFQGWAVSPGGSAVYRNHAEVLNLSEKQGDIVTFYAVWKYTGGDGGGGKVTSQEVKPEVVYEETIPVENCQIISVSLIDEDGNYVDLPVCELVMTGPVTGSVYLKDVTEETNAQTLLIENASSYQNPLEFRKVVNIAINVTGGRMQEILFSVPLDELTENGFTMTDVVMYQEVTENGQKIWYPQITRLEWYDDSDAYYAALIDGTSQYYGIMFLKDTSYAEPVTDEEPVKTPFPVIGIAAGLGLTGILALRRK